MRLKYTNIGQNHMNMKRKFYNFIVYSGLKVLSSVFPDIHMSIPLKPSDRFLEYPFAIGRLPEKGSKLLDIGSAGSFFPLMVAAMGYDVTACDLRPYEILNSLTFKNFRFIQYDLCKSPLLEERFETITCISVLEHIGLGGRYGVGKEENADLKMMEQIKKLLKPFGHAIVTVPYGIAETIAPYHRIYDYARIKMLESGFKVIEEIFYKINRNNDWEECCAREGETIKCGKEKYGLALLYLKNNAL